MGAGRPRAIARPVSFTVEERVAAWLDELAKLRVAGRERPVQEGRR
jgi:hypothetical protein